MDREEFRTSISETSDEHPSFLEYFIHFMESVSCKYTSLNTKISAENREFCAKGVRQALNQYTWPTTVTIPGSANRPEKVENFTDTFDQLTLLRNGITETINGEGNLSLWTREILKWGMGPKSRWSGTQEFIENHQNAPAYLNSINQMASLDGSTDDIDVPSILRYNSGMSKIHSLSSTTGLIIYDSRVAFTLGECVNSWLKITETAIIPGYLNFMQAGRRSQVSKKITLPNPYHLDRNHNREQRDNGKWLDNQMRASWLFRIALENHNDLWVEDEDNSIFTRMHKLEAAFFMLGAYSNTIEIPPYDDRQISRDQLEAA